MIDEIAGEVKATSGRNIDVNFDVHELKRAVRRFKGPYSLHLPFERPGDYEVG